MTATKYLQRKKLESPGELRVETKEEARKAEHFSSKLDIFNPPERSER